MTSPAPPGAVRPTSYPADDGRNESEAQRLDRNLGELLQELRVAGIGVQVLFGFLLAMPFSNRFVRLDSFQRGLYLSDLLFAAAATALLLAPVAYHRLLFRQHEKAALLRMANWSALFGLVAVALAISTAIWLDVSFVSGGAVIPLVTGGAFATIATLWFGIPLWRRVRLREQRR